MATAERHLQSDLQLDTLALKQIGSSLLEEVQRAHDHRVGYSSIIGSPVNNQT